jgi:hypothetical protein
MLFVNINKGSTVPPPKAGFSKRDFSIAIMCFPYKMYPRYVLVVELVQIFDN